MTPETQISRQQLEDALRTGYHLVTFYKVDGTLREMVCTRDADIIPAEQNKVETTSRVKSATTLTVWDLVNVGWRSFLVENVVDIEKYPL